MRERVFSARYGEDEPELYGRMGAAQALIRLLDERRLADDLRAAVPEMERVAQAYREAGRVTQKDLRYEVVAAALGAARPDEAGDALTPTERERLKYLATIPYGEMPLDCIPEWNALFAKWSARRADPGDAPPADGMARLVEAGVRHTDRMETLARRAVQAAQAVIGQCDCTMAETSERDPKRLWREARDAFLSSAPAAPPRPADRDAALDALARQQLDTPYEALSDMMQAAIARGVDAVLGAALLPARAPMPQHKSGCPGGQINCDCFDSPEAQAWFAAHRATRAPQDGATDFASELNRIAGADAFARNHAPERGDDPQETP